MVIGGGHGEHVPRSPRARPSARASPSPTASRTPGRSSPRPRSKGVTVVLPVDVVVAKEVTRGTEYKTVSTEKVPASWHIVDVGKQSLELIEEALADVKTVLWNGPLGVFEIPSFAHGTKAIARFLADRAEHGAQIVIGGGDSVAAITQQGLADKMTHISTGGGA